MARIATVCTDERGGTSLVDMGAIRWYEMSRALSELGHTVDIVHGRFKWRLRQPIETLGARLRQVPIQRVRWSDYDVVKTLFHRGFETLERWGGGDHPFVISKLGSVVGPEDRAGIYFFGRQRAALYRTQKRISARSRFVTLLSEPARALWRESHGGEDELLLVPGACRATIPPKGVDPYPDDLPTGGRVLFAGNFYSTDPLSQPEAHRTIARKLNELGERLAPAGISLCVIGPGDPRSLDARHVRYLGVIPYEESWNYLRWADAGLVVSAGPFMHNNESTKVYHYLRVGLPVVSESGFPNDHLIGETGHGSLVPSGDTALLAAAVEETIGSSWDREAAEEYVLREHTWEARARVYDDLIRRELP